MTLNTRRAGRHFFFPPPTTKAQRPRKQWAQKRNFQNAKPGQSLPGTNPAAQPLNRDLRREALPQSSAHWGWKGFPSRVRDKKKKKKIGTRIIFKKTEYLKGKMNSKTPRE